MVLTLQNITKQYKDKLALKGFSLEMTEGIYGLLGPNGAGKTTLMRIIADVLRPTEGSVRVDGELKEGMNERYRDLLGYLPQELGIYKSFTAYNFLMYIASLKGIEKHRAKSKAEELLEITGLKDSKVRLCGSFSGGMKRRLGIAQALLNDPKILILDEPTSGLDPKERVRFRNLISGISQNRIVLLSTHIVSDLDMIAKAVILLREGQLIRADAGKKLLEELDGKVWNVKIPESRFVEYENKYTIGNLTRRDGLLELRILSDARPEEAACPDSPTLEDMYLYFFKEKEQSGQEEAII